MSDRALLEFDGIRLDGPRGVLLDVPSLAVERGGSLFLVGPNGAGKSELLAAVLGLFPATGKIRFEGCDLSTLSTPARIRAGIAIVPQGGRLFPQMSIGDNLLTGAHLRHDRTGIQADLDSLQKRIPWLADRWGQPAGSLSGGERLIVSLARAVMAQPRLLLVDEPTVGLSAAAQEQVCVWLRSLADSGVTVLGADQNVSFVARTANRVAVAVNGRVGSSEAVTSVLGSATSDRWTAARLFGTLPSPDSRGPHE